MTTWACAASSTHPWWAAQVRAQLLHIICLQRSCSASENTKSVHQKVILLRKMKARHGGKGSKPCRICWWRKGTSSSGSSSSSSALELLDLAMGKPKEKPPRTLWTRGRKVRACCSSPLQCRGSCGSGVGSSNPRHFHPESPPPLTSIDNGITTVSRRGLDHLKIAIG
jgi:hypothetical protein